MNHSQKKTFRLMSWLLLATLALWMLGLTAGSTGFETALGLSDPVVQDIRLPRTLGGLACRCVIGFVWCTRAVFVSKSTG